MVTLQRLWMRRTVLGVWVALLTFATPTPSPAAARIKDIARIAGLEQLELVGYGVVVGLNGTGDKDLALTKQTAANLMENFNITIAVDDIKSKNIAAVMVTATAPAFHREGDRISVTVSSVGDATSLEGGVLVMTPLFDPNGEVYALAQGSITLGGFSAGSDGAGGMTLGKNHTTSGTIPNAALLKYGQSTKLFQNGMLQLILHHADYTTADRTTTAINEVFGAIAVAKDASTITIQIPDNTIRIGQTAAFVAQIETLSVIPDLQSKVIVNERTGTIVMGGDVQISEAVIAHGNLTVTIDQDLHPSHPSQLAIALRDNTALDVRSLETPDTKVTVTEEEARVLVVKPTTTVRALADTLNVMGTTPRDLISILQALNRLGAIQMELVSM